jgi:hypothetical protein
MNGLWSFRCLVLGFLLASCHKATISGVYRGGPKKGLHGSLTLDDKQTFLYKQVAIGLGAVHYSFEKGTYVLEKDKLMLIAKKVGGDPASLMDLPKPDTCFCTVKGKKLVCFGKPEPFRTGVLKRISKHAIVNY